MKVLVTGGAGFIGSNFIKMLIDGDELHIVNLDTLTYAGNLENLSTVESSKAYTFYKADISDHEEVCRIFEIERPEFVVNLAAESHVDRSILEPGIFVDTNIRGTMNLLEASKKYGIKRFLQVSTDEVYGSLGKTGYFTEDTPLAPNSPYSAAKAGADLICRAYQKTFGMDIVITRCSNNYGPYQFPEKLIPLMIENARTDKELPVYGDGLNVRDWIHVDDHCRGLISVLKNGRTGEIYNIGGKNERTNIDIVKTILEILEKDVSLIRYVKDRPGHDKRYAVNTDKINKELGWKPFVEFSQGLKDTVQWYLDNSEWVQHCISGDYRNYYQRNYENK
ncbi:dTDP-glucose 4,6-dehydratase [bacterium]|nr:dTDP-glucose 4,6-dehydratase [bacterium]